MRNPFHSQKESHVRARTQYAVKLRRNMTPSERRLWARLREQTRSPLKIPNWRPQVAFGPFILDFYCDLDLLGVEVDGKYHEQQQGYDQRRDAYFLRRGIRVLRFTNQQIRSNLDDVMREITDLQSFHP